MPERELQHRLTDAEAVALSLAYRSGGRAQSTELRDWATKELQGYGPDDELPEYRKIAAPLQVNMINPMYSVKRQTISPMELPDFARDVITTDLNLRMGIQPDRTAGPAVRAGDVAKLSPAGAADLVAFMNGRRT